MIKRNNLNKLPTWFKTLPRMEDSWDSLIQTLTGHSDSVQAVAFSPDGKQIASGSIDQTIKLWDAATGDLRKTLTGHSNSVEAIAFSPDGKQIASGSSDRTIKLWDAAKVLKVKRLLGNTVGSRLNLRPRQEIKTLGTVNSLEFSIDGQHFATNLGLIKITSNVNAQYPELLKPLIVSNQWVYYGALPVLFLPLDFQVRCYNVKGDQVAIGFTNGRVLSFDINRNSI